MSTPKIVTICGSTRFRAEIAEANRVLTLAGYIVLAPGVFAHDGDEISDEQKVALDQLHFQKIDLARWIYVVNPGGYIGDSTRREIEYARHTGKGVLALVDVGIDGWSAKAQAQAAEEMAARRAALANGPQAGDFDQMIEASSLGTPEAKALRDSVPDHVARQIVERSKQVDAEVREAFRSQEAALAFRCKSEREQDGDQCTGTVRIEPEQKQGQCSACSAWHGRELVIRGNGSSPRTEN